MKNLLFIAVILSAAFNNLSANNGPETASIYLSANEKSVVLNLDSFLDNADYFKIIDNKGEIIFSDEIEKNRSTIKYNLDQLPNNTYTVKVEGDNLVEYHRISISNDIISLQDSKTYSRPYVRNLDQKVLVNSSSTSEELITLNIYNQRDEKVYSLHEKNPGKYHKAFNLENLKKGTYRVIVSTDHFTHEVEISL